MGEIVIHVAALYNNMEACVLLDAFRLLINTLIECGIYKGMEIQWYNYVSGIIGEKMQISHTNIIPDLKIILETNARFHLEYIIVNVQNLNNIYYTFANADAGNRENKGDTVKRGRILKYNYYENCLFAL